MTGYAARRRSTELGLVVMAGIITGSAYVLASLGRNAVIPPRIIPFIVMLLGLLLIAHLAVRVLAGGADPTMLPLAALLNGLGYVMITRLSERLAGLQTTWTFIAIGMFIATLLFVQRASDLRRYQWTFLFIGVALLVAPMVPGLGRSVNGARIWVSVGRITFQPGEFAKLALALFFAGYLADRRELIAAGTWKVGPFHLPEPRYLLPIVIAWGFSVMVMVSQRDLGSSLLFFALFVVMLWVATEKAAYLWIGAVLFAISAVIAYFAFSHVQTRVQIWLDPWHHDKGYQIIQSMFAIAGGGTSGTGLGLGAPNRVPYSQTDFIFAAISEELGLLGGTAVLIAFVLLIGAGLRTAMRATNPFSKLLATGLTTIIGVQAFIIIGGVIRVVPLTGITLPFVSYGGSSLLANYVLLALLIRISDSTARRLGEVPDTPTISERIAARRLARRVRREGLDPGTVA